MPPCPKCLQFNFDPPLEAWDQDPDGLCLLHSKVKDKDQYAAFTVLVEMKKDQKDYNFAGVYFPGDVSFKEFEFTKDSIFKETIFSGKTDFYGVTFSGKSDFEGATFLDSANFSNAWFSKDAIFVSAEFKKAVHFWGATFSHLARYQRVIFSGHTYFKVVKFSGEAYFWKIKLNEKSNVIFQEINLTNRADNKHIYQPVKATFEGLKQESGAILIFRDCKLSQISFCDADLSRMEFDRVFWPISRNRTVLYDELVLRENLKNPDPLLLNLPSYIAKRCESVERLYRQLKSNYEEKKDYTASATSIMAKWRCTGWAAPGAGVSLSSGITSTGL